MLKDVNKIILECEGKPPIMLPYIQECSLGDDYATIISVTEHEDLMKGLVSTIIAEYTSQDISTEEKVNNYRCNYGEYVLYKIVREWDFESLCRSTYYFIR